MAEELGVNHQPTDTTRRKRVTDSHGLVMWKLKEKMHTLGTEQSQLMDELGKLQRKTYPILPPLESKKKAKDMS
jgi:hypothetical protein